MGGLIVFECNICYISTNSKITEQARFFLPINKESMSIGSSGSCVSIILLINRRHEYVLASLW